MIFVDGQWWGFIGFDDCRNEREWLPSEIDTLKTLAELVGAAIACTRQLKNLNDANRIIENSPTILYRLGAHEPYPLLFLSQNIDRYGSSASELLARPDSWPTLIQNEDLPAVAANINAIGSGKTERARTEFRHKKADGSLAWFDGEGRALRNDRGQLIGIEGLITDITKQNALRKK